MRNVLLLLAVTSLRPVPSEVAEQVLQRSFVRSGSTVPQVPLKRAGAERSCAAYGAGFVRVDGTQTCVKIGGAVSIGVGGSR